MNNLILMNNKIVEVDSRQIAEWIGKEHKQIMREIREEIEELGENVAGEIFSLGSYKDKQNQERPCYKMNRDGVMQLALKYDAVVRYKVIQKLNELEKPQLPQNYLDALKCLVASEEEKARIAFERDEAIKTKAYISDKKTATAMGKLGVVVKENKKLKDKLGEGEKQATIIAMEKKHNRKFNWRELRDYCVANEIEVAKVPDSRYGEVNAYPVEAWKSVYNIY